MEMQGLKEVLASMNDLDKKVANGISRRALREGGKLIAAGEKTLVPVRSGALKKAIKVRAGPRRKGLISILAGISQKWTGRKLAYFGPVEFGHKVKMRKWYRRIKAIIISPKRVPGVFFAKHGYEAQKASALVAITNKMRDGIENYKRESEEDNQK